MVKMSEMETNSVPDPKNIILSTYHTQESCSGQPLIRLSVLGATGVGKTAIIVRFLTKRFIGEYRSQIDMTYRTTVTILDKEIPIEILDFSPKNEDDLVEGFQKRLSDCFLVVFGIHDRRSFQKAVNLVSAIRSQARNAPLTLLGNKSDLEHIRKVSTEELEATSSFFRCEGAEVSAAESREGGSPMILHLLQSVVVQRKLDSSNHVCLPPKSNLFADLKLSPSVTVNNSASAFTFKSVVDSNLANARTNIILTNDKSPSGSAADKPSDDSSEKCQLCSLNHSKFSSLKEEPSLLAASSHLKPPNATRAFSQTSSRPSYSYKDKYDSKIHWNRNDPKCLSESPNKKDSRFKNFLSCNKVDKESDSILPYWQKYKMSNSSNGPSIAVPSLVRGESFNFDSPKSDHSFMSTLRNGLGSPSRSRKMIPNKLLSTNKCDNKLLSTNKCDNKLLSTNKCDKLLSTSKPDAKNWSSKSRSPERPPKPRKDLAENKSTCLFKTGEYKPTDDRTISRWMRDFSLRNGETSPSSPPLRERKFGVFDIVGNMFSKTSLPDLPKATANLYTKFGSIKGTIKKRSV